MVFNVSSTVPAYQIYLFKFFTILSYTNSAINPFLYAFTNDAFKSAFADGFSCLVFERLPHLGDRGGERGHDAGARRNRTPCNEMQMAVLDRAGCRDDDDEVPIQLDSMTTKQLQLHQLNSIDSREMRVTVHLEQQQQQQHEPIDNIHYIDDDQCVL